MFDLLCRICKKKERLPKQDVQLKNLKLFYHNPRRLSRKRFEKSIKGRWGNGA